MLFSLINSLVAYFSGLLGTSDAALRLLISVFAGCPLALVYRKYIYTKSPNVHHIFFISTSFALGCFNFGFDVLHNYVAMLLTYAILMLFGGTAISVAAVFIWNMAYLILGYYYTSTDSYDINWTMSHCILVLRLIAVAYDVYDGQQPPEKLSADAKKNALKETPDVLEFLGHVMFPGSFIIGPQYPMRRYQDFVAGKFGKSVEPRELPDSSHMAWKTFGLGCFYLTVFQLLGLYISDEYMLTFDFSNRSFLYKMLYIGFWGRFTLYKYISCWLLTEAGCTLFGISHNGKDANGNTKWDALENIELAVFENTTEFTDYIKSFNKSTNNWVMQYIYKRLKFLNNRYISQLGTLLFLSVWHGLHSGYYVTFFLEFVVVYSERIVKVSIGKNKNLSTFFEGDTIKLIVNVLLRLYTFIFMGFCLVPFVFLEFDKYFYIYGCVHYSGIILFLTLPFLDCVRLLLAMNSKKKV